MPHMHILTNATSPRFMPFVLPLKGQTWGRHCLPEFSSCRLHTSFSATVTLWIRSISSVQMSLGFASWASSSQLSAGPSPSLRLWSLFSGSSALQAKQSIRTRKKARCFMSARLFVAKLHYSKNLSVIFQRCEKAHLPYNDKQLEAVIESRT